MNYLLIWENVKDKFEIWRLLTCFCYAGKFEFPTLIALYLLMNFSQNYEKGGPFNTGAGGGSADYLFMLLFGAITMIVTQPLLNLIIPISGKLMCRNMIYYVLYIWSKRHPMTNANIWGIPVKAIYLPFAYVLISLFVGAPYMYIVHGIIIGHIYYFLVDVVPHVYGKDVLTTPQFLIDQFGVGIYTPPAAPPPPPPQRGGVAGLGGQGGGGPPAAPLGGGGGHNWGSGGQRLGGT
jgi:Derlin-2/3